MSNVTNLNKLIQIKLYYNLNKLVLPVILNKIDEVIANNEETIFAKYTVQKSNLPIKVDWLKNDKTLMIDNVKYLTTTNEEENSFSLSVTGCNIKDAGKYSICVANQFGKSVSDFRLLIRCIFKNFKNNLKLNTKLFP